jgi:hypothetical protein
MTTLANALDVIEQAKACRPTCDQDERRPFYASLREPNGPEGFELDPNFAGYRKRCPACATGKLYPWADKLDPERVRAFMETDPRCESAWPLSILEETLPSYVNAVDRKIETIMKFHELGMYAYELAGSEEGALELLRSIEPPECVVTKVDHETRTVEMYKVGSTDICMRRNCIDARAEGLADCVCKPEDKAFFQLPAHKTVELTLLPIPYRNFLITRILPPEDSQGVGCRTCGALACTKNHAEFM